jgi:hypothetical protein
LQRRGQLGPARFFFPQPCCAVRRAHLASRDATSLRPLLAQLQFLLIVLSVPKLGGRVHKVPPKPPHVNLRKNLEVS